jgi:hypothetical protein
VDRQHVPEELAAQHDLPAAAQVAKPDIKEHARLKAELTQAGYLN